jgi:hypothetical protein
MVSTTAPPFPNEDYYPSSHLTDHENTPSHSNDSCPSPVTMDTTKDEPSRQESRSRTSVDSQDTDESIEAMSKTRNASSLSSVYTEELSY